MRYGRTSVLRRPKHFRMLSPSSLSKRPPVDVSVREESCTQHEFLQREEFMLSAGDMCQDFTGVVMQEEDIE